MFPDMYLILRYNCCWSCPGMSLAPDLSRLIRACSLECSPHHDFLAVHEKFQPTGNLPQCTSKVGRLKIIPREGPSGFLLCISACELCLSSEPRTGHQETIVPLIECTLLAPHKPDGYIEVS